MFWNTCASLMIAVILVFCMLPTIDPIELVQLVCIAAVTAEMFEIITDIIGGIQHGHSHTMPYISSNGTLKFIFVVHQSKF
ncbi:unnamed protein product [Caenorhabditis brenneri]